MSIIRLVDNLKKAIGWILLLIWLPATSLCLAEQAGWLSPDDCCKDGSTESFPGKPRGDSACCLLGSGSYKAHESERLLFHPSDCLLAIASLLGTTNSRFDRPVPAVAAVAPPELRSTWQFTFRTALSPRAPSFAS